MIWIIIVVVGWLFIWGALKFGYYENVFMCEPFKCRLIVYNIFAFFYNFI